MKHTVYTDSTTSFSCAQVVLMMALSTGNAILAKSKCSTNPGTNGDKDKCAFIWNKILFNSSCSCLQDPQVPSIHLMFGKCLLTSSFNSSCCSWSFF